MARKSQAEIELGSLGKGKKKDKKNKNRKYGRNLKKCAQYKLENRREKNKTRKASRRIKGYRVA